MKISILIFQFYFIFAYMKPRLIIILVLFQIYTGYSFIPASDSVQFQTKLNELRADIEAMFNTPDLSNAFTGICIQSVETGEYFYRLNDTRNFIPASTNKLLTTATALELFGKDFKFNTRIYLDGNLKDNGEFDGNLIIRGGGDPTLSRYFYYNPTSIFDKWAKMLDSLGIKSIKGNIIGDDSYFDDVKYPKGWAWDDFQFTYSSQVNSLTFNDNSVEIKILPGDSVGSMAKINVFPDNNYIRIINNIRTTEKNKATDVYAYRENGSNFIELYGQTGLNSDAYSIEITIEDPTLFFLNVFLKSLDAQRIRFTGTLISSKDWLSKIDYSNLTPFALQESPTLIQIISVINKESHNLASEMLLKSLGKESTGTGSFDNGIEQVLKFAAKSGIPKDKIKYADGSGLSRLNLNSPRYQTTMLNYIYRSDIKEDFMETLAKPGEPGTLRARMIKSRAEKNVKAKTGSMNNVSAICGFLTTRDKETLSFSIMIQGFTVPISIVQNIQDMLLMRVSSFSRN